MKTLELNENEKELWDAQNVLEHGHIDCIVGDFFEKKGFSWSEIEEIQGQKLAVVIFGSSAKHAVVTEKGAWWRTKEVGADWNDYDIAVIFNTLPVSIPEEQITLSDEVVVCVKEYFGSIVEKYPTKQMQNLHILLLQKDDYIKQLRRGEPHAISIYNGKRLYTAGLNVTKELFQCPNNILKKETEQLVPRYEKMGRDEKKKR